MINEEHMETLREAVSEFVDKDELSLAVAVITNRHPADQADLIENLEEETRNRVVAALTPDQLAEILEYLEDEHRAEIIAQIPDAELAPVLDRVDEDVAADIVQDLSAEQAARVIPLLEDRETVRQLLAYPEETAGGRMSPDVVALRRDWTVDEAIQFLRRQPPDEEQPFYLYVVDDDGRLIGVVNIRGLVISPPETPIAAIMDEEAISIRADEDQETAAERLRHYNLMALPVVDADGRLRGVITADDVLDVQVEEATEDIYRMAGVGVKEWAFSPIRESVGRRVPWLAFNMIWAFAGAMIISLFEGTIAKVAALAIFMPMIAGQAGNSGIQTATIAVRSMALGELEIGQGLRLLRKEYTLGLIKGLIFGTVLAVIAYIWKENIALSLIAGTSMLLNMLVAATTGVIVPLTLRRLGIDPATIAGVFDTMITDLMGFLIYLGLATIFITQLT